MHGTPQSRVAESTTTPRCLKSRWRRTGFRGQSSSKFFQLLMRSEDFRESRTAGGYLDRALGRYASIRDPRLVLEEWRSFVSEILPNLHGAWRNLFGLATDSGMTAWRVLPDGRVKFFEKGRVPSAESVNEALATIRDERDWRFRSQPYEFAALLLRHFLDDLQSRGIRVIVFLAPVNPLAWDFFRAHGGYDDTWIRREMGSRGIQIAGTYSPIAAHASPSDFYDAVHPVPELVRRLLSEAGVISGPLQ